jgi:outer membrane protein assembly complex protein YaeT
VTAAVWGKQLLLAELDNLFATEADASLEVGSITFDLLRPGATVRDVSLTRAGRVGVHFDRVDARIDLLALLSRRVELELDLMSGSIDGMLPGSILFDFVDSITTDKDGPPPSWRVILDKLTVSKTDARADVGDSMLQLKGIGVLIKRETGGGYAIGPRAQRVLLVPGNGQTIELGDVRAKFKIGDARVKVEQLLLDAGDSSVSVSSVIGTGADPSLTGDLKLRFDPASYGFDSIVSGVMTGEGDLFGRMEAPGLSMSIKNTEDSSIAVAGLPESFSFHNVNARVTARYGESGFEIRIPDFRAFSDAVVLDLKQELRLTSELLGGALSFDVGTIEVAGTTIKEVAGTVSLAGTFGQPEIDLVARAQNSLVLGQPLGELEFTARGPFEDIVLQLQNRMLQTESVTRSGSSPTVLVQAKLVAGAVRNGQYRIESFPIIQYAAPGVSDAAQIALHLTGEFSGIPAIETLQSTGVLELRTSGLDESVRYQGTVGLDQGVFSVSLENIDADIYAKAQLNLENGGFTSTIKFSDFYLKKLVPGFRCANLSAELRYQAQQFNFMQGQGELSIDKFQLGCSGNATFVDKAPHVFPIQAGVIAIKNFALVDAKRKNRLQFNGSFSLPDIAAKVDIAGKLRLASLLPLFPRIDDVAGTFFFDALYELSQGESKLFGDVSLDSGAISIEALATGIDDLEARVTFTDDTILVRYLSGTMAEGSLRAEGSFNFENAAASELRLNFRDLLLAPSKKMFAYLSGNLELESNPIGNSILKGKVSVNRAELTQDLSLATITEQLLSAVSRAGGRDTVDISTRAARVKNTELDLEIGADGQVFLITNWGSAEISGTVDVQGTVGSPRIGGALNTRGGWFQFNSRRFNITSGRVIFNPELAEPTLEILAETTASTRTGDITQVLLEVNGPISQPLFSLSTDLGHSEQEILALLTSSDSSVTKGEDSGVTFGILDSEDAALDTEESFFGKIRRGLGLLTRLDVLQLKPSYNEQLGSFEPKLVAGKNLTDRALLTLEQFIGRTDSQSEIVLQYRVTERTSLFGRLLSETAQNKGSLGADISYEVLRSSQDGLRVSFQGNDSINAFTLRRVLRVRSRAVMTKDEVQSLESELTDYYKLEGFGQVQVSSVCKEQYGRCPDLEMRVEEGPRSTIQQIEVYGAEETGILEDNERLWDAVLGPASAFTRDAIVSEFVEQLRNEDYLGATVSAAYTNGWDDTSKILSVYIKAGRKIQISFSGNEYLSDQKIVAQTGLLKRTRPFGRNSIFVLCNDIKDLYRNDGYVDVQIACEQGDEGADYVDFDIDIVEGINYQIAEVIVSNDSTMSYDKLQSLLTAEDERLPERILGGGAYNEDELEARATYIETLLQRSGYPTAHVSYHIEQGQRLPEEASIPMKVLFTVQEGVEQTLSELQFEGLPDDVVLEEDDQETLTVEAINNKIALCRRLLKLNGYVSAEFSSRLSADGSRYLVIVEPGPQTRITEIEVTGIEQTKESAFWRRVNLQPGDPWRMGDLREVRRSLLRTGLYDRVEMLPLDGTVDSPSEVLHIHIRERDLETLLVGTGYDTANGVHLFAEGTDRGFFRDGRSLSLRLDGFYDVGENTVSKGIASFRYSDPEVIGGRFRLNEDLRFVRIENRNLPYNLNRLTLASSLDKRWNQGTEVVLGHSIYGENLRDVDSGSIIGPSDSGSVLLSFLSGGVVHTGYDDVLNPAKGYKLSINTQFSSQAILSNEDFFGLDAKGSYLYPLPFFSQLTLANNLNIGSKWAFASSDVIPISQRFFLGGGSTIRGFRENSLGPLGEDGAIIGGDLKIANNFEIRYKFFDSLTILSFLDVGSVFLKDRSVDAEDLRESAGAGIRYHSPVGPIGFDVGFPLDRRQNEPSWRAHFRIGAFF